MKMEPCAAARAIVDITARKAIEQRLIMQYQIAGVLAELKRDQMKPRGRSWA